MAKIFLEIYKQIATKYELTNHILTLGLDFYWRKRAADIAVFDKGDKWLDACTGTGEFAISLKKRAANNVTVHATDFSAEMLEIAKNKGADGIIFQEANTYHLPFDDNSFDLITVSFALRNLKTGAKNFSAVFDEFYRVLKPGGRFVNVETSQPKSIMKLIFQIYTKYIVPFVGGLISRSPKGFKYLASSIKDFYSADDLTQVIKKSGFEHIEHTKLTFGVVAVHKAFKSKMNQ